MKPYRRAANFGIVWLTLALAAPAESVRGQAQRPQRATPANPYASLLPAANGTYPTTGEAPVVTDWHTDGVQGTSAAAGSQSDLLPTSASWIVPADEQSAYVDAEIYCEGDPYPQQALFDASGSGPWYWQILPDGLIYRSYQAGVHESRIGLQWFAESDGRNLWDATLGGRAGLVRFGDGNSLRPQGWQLDIEGAALVRLNLEHHSDLESTDYRFGVPLTYGIDNWQFKFGYYHLSSHLGDERAIREPLTLVNRINYVRDSLIFGASYYPAPFARLYAETAYATNADGGAEPFEFQFGTEFSQSGPTGFRGTPFLAMNVHLREEHDFGGDFTAQTGWLWRGNSGQTMRIGGHYFNGKSSQWQTFDESEEQIGVGVWYDY